MDGDRSTELRQTRAYTRERFDVWNEVPLVPQTTGMSCWAAAAAMLVGWRDRVLVDPREVAAGAGKWSAFSEGLEPDDVGALAQAWGLVIAPAITLELETLREMLARHGPLWLGEASPGLHSIVVTGIYGDGSEDGTFVRINDPWPLDVGERYVLSFRELRRNFRAATEAVGEHAQILHTGGRGRGASFSRHHFQHRSVTRRVRVDHDDPHDAGASDRDDSHDEPHDDEDELMEPYDQPRHTQRPRRSFGAVATRRGYGQAAGEAYIETARTFTQDPLSRHGGTGDNLCLRWNELPSDAQAIDVVVHLHGYSRAAADRAMLEAKVADSGVVLDRRPRPTLGLIPRGRKVRPEEVEAGANPARYTFPGLTRSSAAGLEVLIDQALAWLGATVLGGATPRLGRLILTAHSGGVAHVNALLRNHRGRRVCNPEEVHLFDGIYSSPSTVDQRVDGIVGWATLRLASDRDAAPGSVRSDMDSDGGALRIVYRDDTADGSRRVMEALSTPDLLGADARALAPWYRAERTQTRHGEVAAQFGEPLLALGGGADLAGVDPATAVGQSYGTPVGLFERYRRNPPRRSSLDLPGHGRRRFASGASANPADYEWPSEDEIDEIVREGYVEGQRYVRPLHARALSRTASWAEDNVCVDYRHLLPESGESSEFTFTGDHLAALAAANRFAVPETGKVLFGLRGCEIRGSDDGLFHADVSLSETLPDHVESSCVIGVWDRDTNQVAVFRGSTVPHQRYMDDQLDSVTGVASDADLGSGDRHCNMMLTGLYTYGVGRHRTICGALREPSNRNKVVVRSRNNMTYETSDYFDRCQPTDNVHPSFRARNTEYSSAGCLTVRGNASKCRSGVSLHTNPDDGTPGWRDFRERAGLDANDGDYAFMLLTGREARLVDRNGTAAGLQRLRYGSSGADVEALQNFLVSSGYMRSADGDMGPGTVSAWIRFQKDRDGGHADGIVTPDDASAMNFDLGGR